MSDFEFDFYSILKDEDAYPYADERHLIAADGLGGSGSTLHVIDRSKHERLKEELYESAFAGCEDMSERMRAYIDEKLLPSMVDGRDDTSALWASRIVIGRCAYALADGAFKDADLSDEEVRKELVEFITEGLRNAAKKFDLKKGIYDVQRLLPTTLALIRYKEEEDKVIAETVWAGDSRCYALTTDGLKALSKDDEDGSGAITNLFFVGDRKAVLHYVRHELKKSCALMTVSDGIFDPFAPNDHFGVEWVLQSLIKKVGEACPDKDKNRSSSQDADGAQGETDKAEKKNSDKKFDQLKNCLYKTFFSTFHSDDATMAFKAFGFDSFDDMKEAFAPRAEKILGLWATQEKLGSKLDVIDMTEEEATHYVYGRTSDKFDAIIGTLVDALVKGEPDIAVTVEIRSADEKAKAKLHEDRERKKQVMLDKAFEKLDNDVRSGPNDVMRMFRSGKIFDKEIDGLLATFLGAANRLCACKNEIESLKGKIEGLFGQGQTLHDRDLKNIITRLRGQFDDLWSVKANYDHRRNVCGRLNFWQEVDQGLYSMDGSFSRKAHLNEPSEKELLNNISGVINSYSDSRRKLDDRSKAQSGFERAYLSSWEKLSAALKRKAECWHDVFTPEAIEKYGLKISEESLAEEINREKGRLIIQILKEDKDAVVRGIVRALADHYEETSAIDVMYNRTKLEQMRTYFAVAADPESENAKRLKSDLEKVNAEYTSLLPDGKED